MKFALTLLGSLICSSAYGQYTITFQQPYTYTYTNVAPVMLHSAIIQNPPLVPSPMDALEKRIAALEQTISTLKPPANRDAIRVLQLEAQNRAKDEEIARLKAQLDKAADFDARIKVLTDQIEEFKKKIN